MVGIPATRGLNYNALTPQGLLANREYGATQGIDITSRTDTGLLNDQINNPAVIARYPLLANPNNVYPGFPSTQTLGQALRPYPQWNGIPPFLGPPMGDNWYDSLQIKGTKRYSYGLVAAVAYSWQKELTNGTNSNTSYVTPSAPLINDVFNIGLNKQISGFSQPQTLTISFGYTTPKISGASVGMKALSWVAREWTISGVLSYRSGQILPTPISANNLLANLQRGPSNNPAIWGGGYTFMDRVARPASVSGRPQLEVRPHLAAGVESGGLDGTAVRHVRSVGALLQRLPLAAATGGEHVLRANLLDPGEIQAFGACGIHEYFQPPLLFLAVGWGGVRGGAVVHHFGHRPREHLERHFGLVVVRFRVCELGERWVVQQPWYGRRAAQRPDRGAIHVLKNRLVQTKLS